MYQIDVMSRIPVYEQIVEQTEKFILAGILGKGSFVSEKAKDALTMAKRSSLGKIRDELREMKMAGISRSEIIDVVEKVYREEAGCND